MFETDLLSFCHSLILSQKHSYEVLNDGLKKFSSRNCPVGCMVQLCVGFIDWSKTTNAGYYRPAGESYVFSAAAWEAEAELVFYVFAQKLVDY